MSTWKVAYARWTNNLQYDAKHCPAEERAGPSAGCCFCREKGATSELPSFIRRTSCRAGRTQHLRFVPGIGAFAGNGVRHLFHGEASRGRLRDSAQAVRSDEHGASPPRGGRSQNRAYPEGHAKTTKMHCLASALTEYRACEG